MDYNSLPCRINVNGFKNPEGKKGWFLLCRLEKQAAIGKQMVDASISHITLQKECMFKCQSFPLSS